MSNPARTNAGLVKSVLQNDYGSVRNPNPSLQSYIDLATNMVDQATANALNNKGISLDSTTQELMERFLAAHFYTKTDPTYSNRTTLGASGSFVRGKEEPEPYKDMAISADPSGCLVALVNRKRASILWLGKPPSQQIPYRQRS